jgi:hypothetical protein
MKSIEKDIEKQYKILLELANRKGIHINPELRKELNDLFIILDSFFDGITNRDSRTKKIKFDQND